jgi:hypothetical protein
MSSLGVPVIELAQGSEVTVGGCLQRLDEDVTF